MQPSIEIDPTTAGAAIAKNVNFTFYIFFSFNPSEMDHGH